MPARYHSWSSHVASKFASPLMKNAGLGTKSAGHVHDRATAVTAIVRDDWNRFLPSRLLESQLQ